MNFSAANPIATGRQDGARSTGFSLVEIMVAVSLVAIIIVALLAMLNQTQRAFRGSLTQVDVMEGGASVTDLIRQDLIELTPTGWMGVTNLHARDDYEFTQQQLGGSKRTNFLQSFFFLSRRSDEWLGTGYFIIAPEGGAGTLFRFQESSLAPNVLDVARRLTIPPEPESSNAVAMFKMFQDAIVTTRIEVGKDEQTTAAHRLLDGVVDLQLIPSDKYGSNQFRGFSEFSYTAGSVPATIDVELGILEAKSYDRFRSLTNRANPVPANDYLAAQVPRVHLFRQRVPIRTADATVFDDPSGGLYTRYR